MTTVAGFTFDPDITFGPNNETILTGTAESFVSNVEIFENNIDLGAADIVNGKWAFAHYTGNDPSQEDTFSARVETPTGFSSVTDATFADNDIKGNPFTRATEYLGAKEVDFKMYSASGKLEYHAVNTVVNGQNAFAETGDQPHTQFVFIQDNANMAAEKITNFHVEGGSHDTLLLPHADFANMAELLRDTTMSGGNAMIHDPNTGSTLTLVGVTKTEMKAHPHDFGFHGTGSLTGNS